MNASRSHVPWKTITVSLALVAIVAIVTHACLKETDNAMREPERVIDRAGSWLSNIADKFTTGTITKTFISEIPAITSTHGDVLELATATSTETMKKEDAENFWGINMGTTVAEIRVPVTYRYHLLLSDPWRLAARSNVCVVECPMFYPSLPPAIHTEQMEKSAVNGWARFDKDQTLDELEKSLTPTFEQWAKDPKHMELVREQCRSSVADFVRNWLIKMARWTNRFDTIVIVFPDERQFDSDKALESYDGKPTIHLN